MRRAYSSLAVAGIIFGIIIAGCSPSSAPAAIVPTAAPTSVGQAPGTVGASAVVEPAQQSSMAFLLSAPVKQVYIKAGDQVSAGQPLIMLDTPELEYAI